MNTFKKFINENALNIILFLSIATSIITTAYYFNKQEIVAYNDARSHLNIARRVVDSRTPGVAQLGGSWLPLPHLLMLPFILNDFLWHTGLAGSIISIICYVVASVLIFKLARHLTKDTLAAFTAAFIFMFNRNILYLTATPMTEPLLIVTMVGGIYFFIKWLDDKNYVNLIRSAFAILLSTLSRYDGWFLFIICASLIVVELVFFYKNKKKAEGYFIIFTSLASLGIILWFTWNLMIWGKPFYFLNGEHSARHQQAQIEASGNLLTKHNLALSLQTVTEMSYMNSGIYIMILAIAALLFVLKNDYKNRVLIYSILMLASPVFFNLITLYFGISTVTTGLQNMFNIRYGIMILPFVAIIIALSMQYLSQKKSFIAASIVLVALFIPYSTVTLYDPLYATSGGKHADHIMEKKFLESYQGGSILASAYSFDPMMHKFGIAFVHYIHEGNYRIWDAALKKPQDYVDWIIMAESKENDATYRYYMRNKKLYDTFFEKFYDSNNFLILKKRDVQKRKV